MTDKDLDQNPASVELTIDELATAVTDMFDKTAEISDETPVSAHLLSVWAAHLNAQAKTDVPATVVEKEFFTAIINLEVRIAAIESALTKAGITFVKAPHLKL